MNIKFNTNKDFKNLQSTIACLEESMLHLTGEEPELSIVFYEIEQDAIKGQLWLPYSIYSWTGELIKTASVNVAR